MAIIGAYPPGTQKSSPHGNLLFGGIAMSSTAMWLLLAVVVIGILFVSVLYKHFL